jgi:hypothetical protein
MAENEENEAGGDQFHVDEEKVADEFDRLRAEEEEALKDGAKVRATIGKVFAKLGRTVVKPIVFILDDILMLLAALAAAVTGKYTKFPVVALAIYRHLLTVPLHLALVALYEEGVALC